MITRRGLITGIAAALAAPAIVKADSLMKLWVPPEPKIIIGTDISLNPSISVGTLIDVASNKMVGWWSLNESGLINLSWTDPQPSINRLSASNLSREVADHVIDYLGARPAITSQLQKRPEIG